MAGENPVNMKDEIKKGNEILEKILKATLDLGKKLDQLTEKVG